MVGDFFRLPSKGTELTYPTANGKAGESSTQFSAGLKGIC